MNAAKIEYDPERLVAFCRKRRIVEMSLFGSVLSDRFRPDSDVDVLVAFEPDTRYTWGEWLDMIDDLRSIFGREVDLVSRSAIERSNNPFRKRHILSHLERVYVA